MGPSNRTLGDTKWSGQAQFRATPSTIAHKKIIGGRSKPGFGPPFVGLLLVWRAASMNHLHFVAPRELKTYSATSSRLEVKRGNVDITEVARRSGLTASTLRFYEEKGLIASIGRRGLHRVFDPGVLERLALIALG